MKTLIFCLLSLAVLLTGCQTTPETVQGTPAEILAADANVTRRVKNAFHSGYGYNFPSVNVGTINGTVTLTGFVQTEQQKDYAEELAMGQDGVDRVVNMLTIQETPRSFTPIPRNRGWGDDGYRGY